MNGSSRLAASFPSSQAAQLTAAIVAATAILLWVHQPALNSQALCFDDDQYLTHNLLVQTPSLPSAIRFLAEVRAPSTVGGYYHPLAMISLMLDYQRGGRPDYLRPFHETSLILHAFNVTFVVLILYLLFSSVWLAAGVGLIFGLHPMTVETINWVGERKTLLASFFAFWSILSYVLYKRTARRTYYWLSLVVFLLALLSKPTSTFLPLGLVVLDYWPFQTLIVTRPRTVIAAVMAKWPFWIASILSAIVTYTSHANTAEVALPVEYSPVHIPLIVCHNVMFYTYKLIWPINLSPHYPDPRPFDSSNPVLILTIMGTCGLVALLLSSLSKTKALFAGWLFFFVAIFPTFGVIGFTNALVADKYIYFPGLGLLLSLAWALTRVASKVQHHVRPAYGAATLAMILGLLLVAYAVETRKYIAAWKDSEALGAHMFRQYERSPFISNYMGAVLYEKGKGSEAMRYFQNTIELDPQNSDPYNNLGVILIDLGRTDEAIATYQQALRIKPDDMNAMNNLVAAFISQGMYESAMNVCQDGVDRNPEVVQNYYNMAIVLARQGRLQEAIEAVKRSLRLQPVDIERYKLLGQLHLDAGKYDEGNEYFRRALELDARSVQSIAGIGLALVRQSKVEEGIARFHEAIGIEPRDPYVHVLLARALAGQGKLTEAISAYREAVRLHPDYDEAQAELDALVERKGANL